MWQRPRMETCADSNAERRCRRSFAEHCRQRVALVRRRRRSPSEPRRTPRCSLDVVQASVFRFELIPRRGTSHRFENVSETIRGQPKDLRCAYTCCTRAPSRLKCPSRRPVRSGFLELRWPLPARGDLPALDLHALGEAALGGELALELRTAHRLGAVGGRLAALLEQPRAPALGLDGLRALPVHRAQGQVGLLTRRVGLLDRRAGGLDRDLRLCACGRVRLGAGDELFAAVALCQQALAPARRMLAQLARRADPDAPGPRDRDPGEAAVQLVELVDHPRAGQQGLGHGLRVARPAHEGEKRLRAGRGGPRRLRRTRDRRPEPGRRRRRTGRAGRVQRRRRRRSARRAAPRARRPRPARSRARRPARSRAWSPHPSPWRHARPGTAGTPPARPPSPLSCAARPRASPRPRCAASEPPRRPRPRRGERPGRRRRARRAPARAAPPRRALPRARPARARPATRAARPERPAPTAGRRCAAPARCPAASTRPEEGARAPAPAGSTAPAMPMPRRGRARGATRAAPRRAVRRSSAPTAPRGARRAATAPSRPPRGGAPRRPAWPRWRRAPRAAAAATPSAAVSASRAARTSSRASSQRASSDWRSSRSCSSAASAWRFSGLSRERASRSTSSALSRLSRVRSSFSCARRRRLRCLPSPAASSIRSRLSRGLEVTMDSTRPWEMTVCISLPSPVSERTSITSSSGSARR